MKLTKPVTLVWITRRHASRLKRAMILRITTGLDPREAPSSFWTQARAESTMNGPVFQQTVRHCELYIVLLAGRRTTLTTQFATAVSVRSGNSVRRRCFDELLRQPVVSLCGQGKSRNGPFSGQLLDNRCNYQVFASVVCGVFDLLLA